VTDDCDIIDGSEIEGFISYRKFMAMLKKCANEQLSGFKYNRSEEEQIL